MAICDDVVKVLLIVLNAIVLLLSMACVGLGIWALTSDYGANELASILSTDLYSAGCVIIIVAGVIVFLLCFLGAVGALVESKLILLVYFGLMLTFLLVVVVAIIVAVFFIDKIEDNLATSMEETLTTQYGVDVNTNSDNKDVTDVWDNIQKDLRCCGVRGSLTSSESWFLWQSSQWFATEGQRGAITNWWFVPGSCCDKTNYAVNTCILYNAATTQPPKENLSEVLTENPALYHDGCLDKLKDKIKEHVIAIAVAAGILLLVLCVCLALAIYMVMQVGQRQQVV